VTHEKVAHLQAGIVGVAVAIAIGEHFDTDPDCDLDTDPDRELLGLQFYFRSSPSRAFWRTR